MHQERPSKLTAAQVLQKYTKEALPEFFDRPVENVNQVGMTGDRPIHIACIRGNMEEVTALIEGGADVRPAGDMGDTPLHHAASRGLLDITKLLLRHGADINVRNEFGQTPVDLARLMLKQEVAQILDSAAKDRS